jgi:hypothetical protein
MRLRGQRALQRRGAALVCMGLFGLAGCGASAQPRRTVGEHRAGAATTYVICKPAARAAIARRLGIGAETLTERQGTGNNDEPQCTFGARDPRWSLIVNVDSSPQPYARLERTVDEAAQIFTARRASPAPQNVSHLGLVAAWLPGSSELMTTDTKRLITVTVNWAGASLRRRLALATVAARPYLVGFNPKAFQQTEY